MSVEAITWALNLAPVPMDPGRVYSSSHKTRPGEQDDPKPNSACAFVLVGLANHADPDGTNAFPGVDTIVRYTRLSERTVRTALDRLEESGVIVPCDPAVLAAKIKRADRRPNGYDLNFALLRDDLSDTELIKIGKDHPWLRPWIEQHRAERGATVAGRARGATVAGRENLDEPRGATVASHGVQPLPTRGATVAPEPSFNHPKEPKTPLPPAEADSQDRSAADAAVNADAGPDQLFIVAESAQDPVPTCEDFYALYPKKKDPKLVQRSWAWAVKQADPVVIMAGLRRYLEDPEFPPKDHPQYRFVPNPSSWLRNGAWANEEPEPPLRGGLRATYRQGPTDEEDQETLRAMGF